PADRRAFAALAPFPRDVEGRYRVPLAVSGVALEAIRGRPLTSGGRRLAFTQWPAHLVGEVAQRENHRTLALKLRLADGASVPLTSVKVLSAVPAFVLAGTDIHRLETQAPLEQLQKWLKEPTFEFRREDTSGIDFALSALRRHGAVLDAGAEVAQLPPRFALTLEGNAESVRGILAVRYGTVELPLNMAGASTHVTTDGRLVRRDVDAEGNAIAALERAGLLRTGDGTYAARGDAAVEFWTQGAERLPSDWELFGPSPKKMVRVRQLKPNLGLKQAPTGWFSLDVAFAADDQSIDLKKLRPLLQAGRRYVQLSDGSMGELPRELTRQLKGLMDETGAEPQGTTLNLAPYEAGAVERLIELVPEALVAPDTRRFLAALRDFHGIEEAELPVGLKAELRPYQRRGFDWLCFLHRFGLAGVLADDMGLGKTLQALALLLRVKKDEGRKPSLIIAPTSVLTNWQREAEKFTPSLKTVVYDGPDRDEKRQSFKTADVVLTSYAILRRDAEPLTKTEFRYVILDEAQHIKNPGSLGARAARSLKSERRLALTGTPLENRLAELWSLFDFLMPGFLGTEGQFRNRYARPIEIDGDSGVRERLKRRVHPFMLRRLKDEVARDLPARTDSVLAVELSQGQQALYREMLETARSRVHSIIEAVGFKKARISILSELLRLRQVCCDPRLLKLPPGT
ncbi:MAG: DEAD/DEAH box helicase, partial [Myxococcales bacterium]